ncbi:SulP family inorganic anion transporter [Streptomyces sp. ODS28]|uniref:SulP family inorganic anion transporter n=1 Tax=Streptomyces sp. ODS28 TaxID=3136688 RepID=UPI0031F0B7D5
MNSQNSQNTQNTQNSPTSLTDKLNPLRSRGTLRADFTASLVVFLVAVPLCVGVAVASGVPAELGLITGIVGGLVTGFLPGSSLQVSGPAAGLTVLCYEAVKTYGLAALGVIVLAAGLLQLVMGAFKLGRWFRAISVAVVQGMLAGIGLVIMAGQVYALADAEQPSSGLDKVFGLGGLVTDTLADGKAMTALAVGVGTILVLVFWPKWKAGAKVLPAPLAAVLLATVATVSMDLPIARIEVKGLVESIQPPPLSEFAGLASVGMLGTVLAFTLIASAESLFSAAAVDRLHDGPRTHYDKELMAQGVGNTVCGVLGALPMTAVIVRSAANVQAGAKTKASRVLHGVWLLLFAAAFPAVLELIPVATLAGVLVHAGWKLMPVKDFGPLWREHRAEAVVLASTAIAIVVTDMFEGVLIGLLMSVLKLAWETSHVHVETEDPGEGRPLRVKVQGNATFLRLPKLLDQLESLPAERSVELHLAGLRHVDHACGLALSNWEEEHNREAARSGRTDGFAGADVAAEPERERSGV